MRYNWHPILTNYTQQLSEFAQNLSYEDIPSEVLERAKMILIQTIGAALSAKDVPASKKACVLAESLNGGTGGQATGWISGKKLSAAAAAFQNGTLADMLDWEDTSWTGHPSAGIIPCAWTAAEIQRKGGRDLLTAIVVAYEVYQRIACAVQPSLDWQQEKGWGLCSWQIFACIIPAAKLLELDAEQINQAIGLGTACSTIPTCLHEYTMSDFYHFEHGLRAKDGIVIVQLAKKGIESFMDALDDQAAYAKHMTDVECASWYTKDLGTQWLTMSTLLKHWPANMWVQLPLEITLKIADAHNLTPRDIKKITVDPVKANRMHYPPEGGFESLTHAQFSIPYVLSAALHDHNPGYNWYTPEVLSNPDVLEFSSRIVAGTSPQEPRGYAFKVFREGSFVERTVTIETFSGEIYQESMRYHPGHPANMMSCQEFSDRFRIQAGSLLGKEKTERALEALLHIENCENVSELDWIFSK